MSEGFGRLIDWLDRLTKPIQEFNASLTAWERLGLGVVLFVVMFTLSLAAVTFILVKLPATYFADHQPTEFAEHHPVIRWILLILKNLLGVFLILFGIVLSLPLMPGQGLLTIVIGLMLMNFPGKRTLEKRLVSQPRVLNSINALRTRFGKPPLVLELPRPDAMLGAG